MSEIKLTVAIITFNEEKNIERCLLSVKEIADQILVVDSYSTDDTEKICKTHQVDFVQHEFKGHIEQKNKALALAKYDHVLSLDADEAFPELLSGYISDFILSGKTDTSEFPNWDTEGVWLKGLTEVSNDGWLIGNDSDGFFVLKKDIEAEIDTETKTVTINGNVYDGSTSKTEFDTNPDAPEYLDVVLNDDVFDVQSLSVLYFAKK